MMMMMMTMIIIIIEIHTTEPLVPEPSSSDVEIAVEKLKRYKSPGIDQIPAELIQAGGNTLRSEIHKLINCIWNKEALPGLKHETNKDIYLALLAITGSIVAFLTLYFLEATGTWLVILFIAHSFLCLPIIKINLSSAEH
jgi:hypothetical protein